MLFAVALLLWFMPAAGKDRVYMLRLDDEIGTTTWRYTRQALDEAQRMDADMILVHINTYGGSVVHADSIRTALLNSRIPIVGFVDNNAASAGALIALACDTVVMRGGATMGAATVVNGADGTEMPDKYQSYMRGMMRSTAEHHGKTPDGKWRRDPLIAEAMVDSRISVPGIIDSTKVLTLTTDEAIRHGFADARAESVAEVLADVGVKDYTIDEYHPTWVDKLIGFLTSPVVQAILIMIILGGIYMELQTAGTGFPSAAAITAAIFYFLPLFITGIVSPWIVVVFAVGLVLILLEIFVVPGFGITGISGIVLVCAGLALGLIENLTFSISLATGADVLYSLLILGSGIVLAIAGVWYLTSAHGPKWVRRHTDLTTELRVGEGFVGVDMQPATLIGHEGTACTDMRPSGKVEIDGERLDAVSVEGFIYAGTRVRIVKYENAQIYVRSL